MDDERVELYVLGISYSPLQSGAFAMLLAQKDGPYRLPIVIGAPEAQSIAIQIERIVTPRPITHDLFCSFAHAFSVDLEEVFIYKYEDGIFRSEMVFNDGSRQVRLDARTSDAIAIALRMGAPIFTTMDLLKIAGTVFDRDSGSADSGDDSPGEAADSDDRKYEDMSLESLHEELDRLIAEEDYEEAAKVTKIINIKENNQ